jgi:hypothetical protein
MKPSQTYGRLLMVVLAISAFGSAFGGVVTCTPATCEGPVYATFESENCTGEPTFQPIYNQLDVCDEEGFLTEIDETGIWSWDFRGSNCDRTLATASYEVEYYAWGACKVNLYLDKRRSKFEFSEMRGSRVYLANVNDSYVSPQTFDNQDLPSYNLDQTLCFSTDNCSTSNEQPSQDWYTAYSATGCAEPLRSYSNAYEQLNVCTNYRNLTYAKAGCFDAKGSYFAYFSDAACTELISVSAYRYDCSTSDLDNHCTASITSIPMPVIHEPIPSPETDTTPVSTPDQQHEPGTSPSEQQEPGTSPTSSTPIGTPNSPTGAAGSLQSSSLLASIAIVALFFIGFSL